ncbi:MAG: hypothetical protein ABL894_14245 [Hyphomicrobium sp.]
MAFNKTFQASVLAISVMLALGSTPASAGQARTIVMTPKGDQAAAIREGLRIYGWANSARNNATVDQRGRGNAAGVSQSGAGNYAAVVQRGSKHSATVAQTGNNNAIAVFQVGRGRQLEANQTGNGKTAVVVQIGR